MLSTEAIEAINFDQLATPTDRLLLRSGRAARRRSSVPSLAHHSALGLERASHAPISAELPSLAPPPLARGSSMQVGTPTVDPFERTELARAQRPAASATYVVRRLAQPRTARGTLWRPFGVPAIIPVLLGIALGLAAML